MESNWTEYTEYDQSGPNNTRVDRIRLNRPKGLKKSEMLHWRGSIRI